MKNCSKRRSVVKKVLFVMVLLCMMSLLLTSCATTLKGTYAKKDGLISQSFTFEDDSRVKMSAFGIQIEGEYRIEDGKITITYSMMNLSYDWTKDFKKSGNSIYIDGEEFVKE